MECHLHFLPCRRPTRPAPLPDQYERCEAMELSSSNAQSRQPMQHRQLQISRKPYCPRRPRLVPGMSTSLKYLVVQFSLPRAVRLHSGDLEHGGILALRRHAVCILDSWGGLGSLCIRLRHPKHPDSYIGGKIVLGII